MFRVGWKSSFGCAMGAGDILVGAFENQVFRWMTAISMMDKNSISGRKEWDGGEERRQLVILSTLP